MKKIGIIGSGALGQTLANCFLDKGYKVLMGTRNQYKLTNWKSQSGLNVLLGTIQKRPYLEN